MFPASDCGGNATQTANNLLASEFRLGVVAELSGQELFVLVGLAVYDLLKQVNRRQAWRMLILVAIPIAFLRGADFLSVFENPERDGLVMLFLNWRDHALPATFPGIPSYGNQW